jgi:hypothetical protein
MFDKIKQGKDMIKMRNEGKKLMEQMALVTDTYEGNGFLVKATGDNKIEYLEIDGESKPELVKGINTALKNAQEKAAKKMVEEHGLSGLLGGMGK